MKEADVASLLTDFVDGITKAHGASACLVHEHSDPRFIPVRDKLGALREKTIQIAIAASGYEVKNGKR